MIGRLRVTLLLIVAALVLVGVAGAANSASFNDPAGDVGSGLGAAPDLTNVAVSSDDSGTLTFRVTVANRPLISGDDELCVNLDLDQNPDTGTVLYGTEVAFCFEGAALTFMRPNSSSTFFSQAIALPSLTGTFSSGVATFSVKAADLGLAPNGGFNVFAESHSFWPGVADYTDMAPNLGTVNYQLVPGTPSPALGPDTRPPFDQALTAHGARGKVVPLRITTSDGRGQTADTFRVYQGRHLLTTRRYGLFAKNPLLFYYFPWRAPRHISGPLKFCVNSVDAAGNKSNTACARIILH